MATKTAPSESEKREAAVRLAEKLQEHYGDRLRKVIRIPRDPYDGESIPESVFAVAVLEGDVTPYAEIEDVGAISEAVDANLDFEVYSSIYVTSQQSYEDGEGPVARTSREEGNVITVR